jgi:MFS family permease
MQKVPIGRWLGLMVFFWGLTCVTAAACTNFAGIMVDRFFLGVFEASNTPIFAIIVGQYYTRDEQPIRACIWWASAGIAGFFGDSMALKMGETHGALSTWQVKQHSNQIFWSKEIDQYHSTYSLFSAQLRHFGALFFSSYFRTRQ